MICSYCQRTRNDTMAPCPYCGAPAEQASMQIGGWGLQGDWQQGGQAMPIEQMPFEASPPISYTAQNWAIPETPQNQQQWNNGPQGQEQQWNAASQNDPSMWGSPQPLNQQPSWNSIQTEWDKAQQASQQQSWVGTPQDQSQQGWNMPQQVSPSLNRPQQDQSQQGWNMPQQVSPNLGGSQQDQQQWSWGIPAEGQQQWGMTQQQDWNTPQQDQQSWNGAQSMPLSPGRQQSPAGGQMGLVPYQGALELQAASSRTSMLQILPADIAERMLPSIPQEEMAVYVPPMYTKPRAIIPRYRAISGLLSIIIVGLMLCTGAGYAAKATGTIDTLTKIVTGDSHPAAIQKAAASTLPEPKTLIDRGPAYGIIYSATTTSRVDPDTGLPIQEEHVFTANETIHLTYAVKSAKAGTVQIQWYSNGNPLVAPISPTFDPKDGQNKHADASIVYQLPAEGWVDLKWNNQLAMRLYFVVRAA